MIDPKVLDIIIDTILEFDELTVDESTCRANAIIGALSVAGFAIVAVDSKAVQRVLSEMSKKNGH